MTPTERSNPKRRLTRWEVWWLAVAAVLVPALLWAVPDLITRDSTNVPCPAIDDSTGDCRNLRYNNTTTSLDVNIKGAAGTAQTGGAVAVTGSTTPANALTNPTTAIPVASLNSVYNNATWDLWSSARLALFPTASTATGRNAIGVGLVEKSSRWSVVSNPGAGSQATASIALETGVRHVADCITVSAAWTTAPAATIMTINLRDGASGAGTIIWTMVLSPSVVTSTDGGIQPVPICGLNLVGTTATAMTLEFSASLANLTEAVSLSGFNVN